MSIRTHRVLRFNTWIDPIFDATLDAGTGSGYWGRVAWLYRNPAYGFSYWALGIPFVPTAWSVTAFTGDEHLPGFTFRAVCSDGHFNLHAVRFGLRFKLGWKAWNQYEQITGKWKTSAWGPQMRIPFVFSISIAR